MELARELGRIREEVGCLKGQLKEIRAANLRLQKEVKEGVEEHGLMEEDLEASSSIAVTVYQSHARYAITPLRTIPVPRRVTMTALTSGSSRCQELPD